MFTLDPDLQNIVNKTQTFRQKYNTMHCEKGVSGVRALYQALDKLPVETCKDTIIDNKNVQIESVDIEMRDGSFITARWTTNRKCSRKRAILYIHGGGMIIGTATDSDDMVSRYVEATGVNMLSVNYRLSPEFGYPIPINDCFDSLKWLVQHAIDMEIEPDHISVMGESSGGCLAAAVALLARDEGIHLDRQLLIYPMLDDRTMTADRSIVPFLTWTEQENITGWQAFLGDLYGKKDIPDYASPARCINLTDVAAAYIEVAELDLFRDEDINFCSKLLKAGVPVEMVLYSAVPHSFDSMAPGAQISQRAFQNRCRIISA
jgi:acetyl esterase/lipase